MDLRKDGREGVPVGSLLLSVCPWDTVSTSSFLKVAVCVRVREMRSLSRYLFHDK